MFGQDKIIKSGIQAMEESSRQRLFIEAKNEETGERRPGDYV